MYIRAIDPLHDLRITTNARDVEWKQRAFGARLIRATALFGKGVTGTGRHRSRVEPEYAIRKVLTYFIPRCAPTL